MTLKVKPAQAVQILAHAIANKHPVLLVGAPGVGKTALVSQAAKLAGANAIYSYPATDEPTDGKGLPVLDPKTGEYDYQPLGAVKKVLRSAGLTVWCLEDLGQAGDEVQAAYMSTLSARELGCHKLPDDVTVVATTNKREHRAGVKGLLEPVKSRFYTIIEVVPDIEDWTDWALQHGVHPTLVAYLRMNPDMLLQFSPTSDMVNSPNPRSWAACSDWLYSELPDDLKAIALAGAVGVDAMQSFMAFRKMAELAVSPDMVIAAPATAPIPEELTQLNLLCAALAHYTNELTVDAVCTYALRLYDAGQGEMAARLVKDAFKRHPELQNMQAWVAITTGPLQNIL